MVEFPYVAEPLIGLAPPSLPAGTTQRWRPLVPITLCAANDVWHIGTALVDTGSADTIFPLDALDWLGLQPLPSGHQLLWRGLPHPMRFATVEMELNDGKSAYMWSAVVAFSSARTRYPLLGMAGCLEFFDLRFGGASRIVQFESNQTFPGMSK